MTCGTSFPKKAAFTLLGGMLTLLFSLGLGMTGLPVSALSGSAAEAAVKYVTPGGAGAKDGSSWDNAYGEAELPAAIQSADAGDEFWVAAGAYRPSVTNAAAATFTLKNGVALYGGFAGTETARTGRNPSANVTVLTGDLANDDAGKVNGVTLTAGQIQGTNSKTVVTADNSITDTTVLDGFTVTAGKNTTGNGGGMCNNGGSPIVTNCTFSGNRSSLGGGGMANRIGSNPAIANCTFAGNSATNCGGGMYNYNNSSPTVTDCTFSGNTASSGGGMFNTGSSPIVTDCTFSGNTASYGGGMFNTSSSSPTVTGCTFSGNSATNYGGGMDNYFSSPTVTDCTFSGNTASYGGGMFNTGSSPTVTNCTFANNTATTSGGGMTNDNTSPIVTGCTFTGNRAATEGGGMYNYVSNPIVTDCTFWENTATNNGGGMYNYNSSSPTVTNCTFANNSAVGGGGGMFNDGGSPIVTNCIFWGAGGTSGQIVNNASSPTVTCSVTDVSGTGNTSADPHLGPLAWHGGVTETMPISAGSSALDAGLGTGEHTIGGTTVTVLSADQRGVFRPQGASVDIGAYEYWAGKALLAVETEGSGTVTRTPGGDVFGASGTQWSYDTDTGVTLSADAAAPWYFVAWSGDASGTNPVTSVTMSGDKHVTARFARKWTITASADANGTIAPAGSVAVPEGTSQTFTVTPNAGYAVAGVTVDGVSVGATTTYTFPNVTADHTIQATFTAAPTATPTPPNPTATPTATPTSGPTPSPFPSPDPNIPLPEVTLTLTLLSGGTILAGPVEITDPGALEEVLSSLALLAQLVDFDPDAIAAGEYNLDLVRFFSVLARLDPGVTELVLLLEVTMGAVAEGYTSTVFLLARTFDDQGNPTGYTVLPREEGTSVFRRSATTETWRVAIADGGATDGAPEAGRVLPNLAAVVAVVRGEAPTGGGGGGGGCDTGAGDGNGFFGGALPVLLLLAGPLALLLQR